MNRLIVHSGEKITSDFGVLMKTKKLFKYFVLRFFCGRDFLFNFKLLLCYNSIFEINVGMKKDDLLSISPLDGRYSETVSYTHLRAHET